LNTKKYIPFANQKQKGESNSRNPEDLKFHPVEAKDRLIANVDLLASLGTTFSPIANYVLKNDKKSPNPSIYRRIAENFLGIHAKAELPAYVPRSKTLKSTISMIFHNV
jgi:hypothetical protein